MNRDFRDFQDILTDLDDGQVHERLTSKLRDVVAGCREAQLSGSLTLKITITPEGRQFIVNPKITTSIPTPKTGITMFFADERGDLRKEDPKQVSLKHVNQKPTELRTVAPKGE
jgi:hypothetical protein